MIEIKMAEYKRTLECGPENHILQRRLNNEGSYEAVLEMFVTKHQCWCKLFFGTRGEVSAALIAAKRLAEAGESPAGYVYCWTGNQLETANLRDQRAIDEMRSRDHSAMRWDHEAFRSRA